MVGFAHIIGSLMCVFRCILPRMMCVFPHIIVRKMCAFSHIFLDLAEPGERVGGCSPSTPVCQPAKLDQFADGDGYRPPLAIKPLGNAGLGRVALAGDAVEMVE